MSGVRDLIRFSSSFRIGAIILVIVVIMMALSIVVMVVFEASAR